MQCLFAASLIWTKNEKNMVSSAFGNTSSLMILQNQIISLAMKKVQLLKDFFSAKHSYKMYAKNTFKTLLVLDMINMMIEFSVSNLYSS